MSENTYNLTPEQIALSEERKRNKRSKEKPLPVKGDGRPSVTKREWIQLQSKESNDAHQRVKIMTWNLLAQILVRRELFPNSDCLKAGQREPMLFEEILSQKADVICLQEVDRIERLGPVLERNGYTYIYASAPGKKHGCVVAFDSEKYCGLGTRLIQYDEQDVRTGFEEITRRRGVSFKTRNIGSLVALKDAKDGSKGLVIGTTHLFWHPKYKYERSRQAGILFREITKFRMELQLGDWPCILAGDFNCTPDNASYSLIMGDDILPSQEGDLLQSRVVHFTIDPTVPNEEATSTTKNGEAEGDPDRVIKEARPAVLEDGLLSTPELISLFSASAGVRSIYAEAQRTAKVAQRGGNLDLFGERTSLPQTRHGYFEPAYTSYTRFWKNAIDPPSQKASILGFLRPHDVEILSPGLPLKGVCGSDHLSLCAELFWE